MDTNNTKATQSESRAYPTPYNIDIDNLSDKLRGEFILQVNKLPILLRFIMLDFSTAEFFEEKLKTQFKFSNSQNQEIIRITRDALLSKTYLGDIVNEIKTKLATDAVKAKEVANYLLTNLFSKEALEELKVQHKKRFSYRVEEKSLQSQLPQTEPAQTQTKPAEDKAEDGQQHLINLRTEK